MHGLIFAELKKYVDTKFGPSTWDTLLVESGIGPKIYLTMQTHPDAEIVTLVSTASRKAGIPIQEILEDFGEFLVPAYLRLYGHLLKPEWRTLDVIEHTEETIHKVVRVKNPGAAPPELRCRRPSKHEVILEYTSPRKMCAVARGITKGVAKHFNERLAMNEAQCMLRGAPCCEISIKVFGPA
jgi:predicted hydrocarbon binding protein